MAGKRAVPAALGAGLLAYVVQQQVLFPHPAVDTVFWLLAGVLVAAEGIKLRPVRSWLIMGAGACVVLGSFANPWSLMRSDHDVERALSAETRTEALDHLSDAADRRSFDDEPYTLMGVLLQDSEDIRLIAEGEERIRRGAQQNPGNEPIALALAEVRLQAYRVSGDPTWAHRARAGLDELIKT